MPGEKNERSRQVVAFIELFTAPRCLYFRSKDSYSLLMKSVISSKGQITVPIEIRSKLGLNPGTVVIFQMTKNGALLRKGTAGRHPVEQVYGVLNSKQRTDELLDELRGARPVKRAKRS